MKKKAIERLSNDEFVDMNHMSEYELKKLHFKEEKWCAEKVMRLPPFSDERKLWLSKGYEFAIAVMAEYMPNSKVSQGANIRDVNLVLKMLKIRNADGGGTL